MKIIDLNSRICHKDLDEIEKYLLKIPWIEGIPGGFVTNSPKRKVYTFGNGLGINNKGEFIGSKIIETYWTPKMCNSNCSLYSKTNEIPNELIKIILLARDEFKKNMTNCTLTDYSFNIAVCNYYTEHNMNIAAHTDDNQWYPAECAEGPVFASLTIYPHKKPTNKKEYARFQIKKDGKWNQIDLPNNSLMIMPSSIEHRVMGHTKSNKNNFCPRINITFRSSYEPNINPLMHRMSISNHTRYYAFPYALRHPSDFNIEIISEIITHYNSFLRKYGRNDLIIISKNIDRKPLIIEYRKKFKINRVISNMVAETFSGLS